MPCRQRRNAPLSAKEQPAGHNFEARKNKKSKININRINRTKGETEKPAVNKNKAPDNSGIGMGILRGRERAISTFPSPYIKTG